MTYIKAETFKRPYYNPKTGKSLVSIDGLEGFKGGGKLYPYWIDLLTEVRLFTYNDDDLLIRTSTVEAFAQDIIDDADSKTQPFRRTFKKIQRGRVIKRRLISVVDFQCKDFKPKIIKGSDAEKIIEDYNLDPEPVYE